MTFLPAPEQITATAPCGVRLVGLNNNNRNNASHPRAGD